MVDVETLKQKCGEFEQNGGRANFYDVAIEIVDKHPLQASIIILAVWNFNRFRFFSSDSKNLAKLREALDNCWSLFEKTEDEDIKTINFDMHKDTIKKIYDSFSKVRGVEYTGASKVMHLMNRNLFVMWDRSIRDKLNYGSSAGEYLRFLRDMQKEIKNVGWDKTTKTLAKAIDEYNYVTITLPKLQEDRRKRKGESQNKKNELSELVEESMKKAKK